MRVTYPPSVRRDVNSILRYYDSISSRPADEFWNELMSHIEAAAKNPEHFHFADLGLRRVNLHRFPYHFLFRALLGKYASQWFGATNAGLSTGWAEHSGEKEIRTEFLAL
jgi:plasmid stabilization system protein ParE